MALQQWKSERYILLDVERWPGLLQLLNPDVSVLIVEGIFTSKTHTICIHLFKVNNFQDKH